MSCNLMIEDDEGLFLAVRTSYFGLSVGPFDDRQAIFHYDFERDKPRYTEAHLQVYGRHAGLERYAAEVGAKERLEKFHLPVGGRRLRPCLEDVIEFLVAEGLVDPRPAWRGVLEEERHAYRLTQIRAVVRKNIKSAVDELSRLGYTVIPPSDESLRAKAASLVAPKPRHARDEDAPPPVSMSKRDLRRAARKATRDK